MIIGFYLEDTFHLRTNLKVHLFNTPWKLEHLGLCLISKHFSWLAGGTISMSVVKAQQNTLTLGENRHLKHMPARCPRCPAATLRRLSREAVACYGNPQRGDVIRGLDSWNSSSAGGGVSSSEWPPDLRAKLIKDIRQALLCQWHSFEGEKKK